MFIAYTIFQNSIVQCSISFTYSFLTHIHIFAKVNNR